MIHSITARGTLCITESMPASIAASRTSRGTASIAASRTASRTASITSSRSQFRLLPSLVARVQASAGGKRWQSVRHSSAHRPTIALPNVPATVRLRMHRAMVMVHELSTGKGEEQWKCSRYAVEILLIYAFGTVDIWPLICTVDVPLIYSVDMLWRDSL